MFSDENDFKENDFFFVFGWILKNVPKNILQCYAKDKAEGEGVRHVFLKIYLRKN